MSNARNLSKFKPSSSGLVETADIADDAIAQTKIDADAVGTTELANDVSIPVGSTLELLTGGKVVVQATDVLKIDCSVAGKIDATLSILEIT